VRCVYPAQNVHLFEALEFIAELTQHIPPKGLQLIRRYGLYSSRIKGRWEQLGHISRVAPTGWRQQHGQPTNVEDSQGFESLSEVEEVDSSEYKQAWARGIGAARLAPIWRRSTRLILSSVPGCMGEQETGGFRPAPLWIRNESHRRHSRPWGDQEDSCVSGKGRACASWFRSGRVELSPSSCFITSPIQLCPARRRVAGRAYQFL